MSEGIYSPSGQNYVYARNRFGKKLLGVLPVNQINSYTEPDLEYSISVNATGTSVLINSVSNRYIEITSYNLVASGAAVLSIKSSGDNIFGPVSLGAGGQINNSNTNISGSIGDPIVLVTTSRVGGVVNYRLV
jgi:hypothetical protein